MQVIADLHVHSRFSRACSKELTLENNALWCSKKGVGILGTGDFTHPAWFKEIKEELIEDEPGLFRLKSGHYPDIRFILSTEVSQIYKKNGKTRRIHNIVFAPSLDVVEKIHAWLDDHHFNRKADGRPILGIDSEVLLKALKEIDKRIYLIPAHAWTPWFSVFGSYSGFDSLEECFGDMTKEIFAIETGLSSDPLMNRSLSRLDHIALISNSDAHSPRNFGREANVFEMKKKSYDELFSILKSRDPKKFLSTIEFYPEEGKYHADGHADCEFWCEPEETIRLGGICPKCKKQLTVGVLARVKKLADRERLKIMPKNQIPFKSIVPLQEVIAKSLGVVGTGSKKVQAQYEKLLELGNEFFILLDADLKMIGEFSPPAVVESIRRMRAGKMHIRPGYDGVYGQVEFYFENDPLPIAKQTSLL
ncbi:MAG: endonuclease Q family protein [Patescibacteria group bacterium]|jgi:uncharacterized protein (TIGR00375 family)